MSVVHAWSPVNNLPLLQNVPRTRMPCCRMVLDRLLMLQGCTMIAEQTLGGFCWPSYHAEKPHLEGHVGTRRRPGPHKSQLAKVREALELCQECMVKSVAEQPPHSKEVHLVVNSGSWALDARQKAEPSAKPSLTLTT